MDKIIAYKEGTNLKEKLGAIRFSYTRPYQIAYASNMDRLKHFLKSFPDALLLYFTDVLSEKDRIILRNIQAAFTEIKICMYSNERFALDAWQLHLFHFDAHPIDSNKITNTYRKYISTSGDKENEFVFKTNEGVTRFPFKSVIYLKAAGNYTSIQFVGDRSSLQTKQLQHFEYCTEQDLNFKRVHRSLIINLRNIQAIGKKEIKFYGSEKKLSISQNLEAKIKRLLLAKN